jgi:hypothetical protein
MTIQDVINELGESGNALFELEKIAKQAKIDHGTSHPTPVPKQNRSDMAVATYAIAVLGSLGKEELLELERNEIIHNSTITGGSLSVAMSALSCYVVNNETSSIEPDHFEQLGRACVSTKNVIEYYGEVPRPQF